MVSCIISSISSVLLVGFAITSEVFLTRSDYWWGSWYRSYDYRSLGIVLSAIQLLTGLLEFAIAIAATAYSCRVLSSVKDNSGSVYPGAVHPGAVYPGAVYPGSVYHGSVYPGAVHPGAFDYQNPGSVCYQYPGSPRVAAPQMAAPQMAATQMADPQMAASKMAVPQMDEPKIQIHDV